jgi:hypothetical protein
VLRPVLSKQTESGRHVIEPITVQFGSDNEPLELVDGGSALGYMFSIAQAPVGADWHTYWLQLLILFSKCLYLAFTAHSFPHDIEGNISRVPVIANVIYLPRKERPSELQHHAFMYGATIPTASANSKDDECRTLAIVWRRNHVLKRTLETLFDDRGLEIVETGVLHRLRRRLNGLILGTMGPASTDTVTKPLAGKALHEGMKEVKDSIRSKLGSLV